MYSNKLIRQYSRKCRAFIQTFLHDAGYQRELILVLILLLLILVGIRWM